MRLGLGESSAESCLVAAFHRSFLRVREALRTGAAQTRLTERLARGSPCQQDLGL